MWLATCTCRGHRANLILRNEPDPSRVERGLRATFDMQLSQDAADVLLDCSFGDSELTRDPLVCKPGRDQSQHLGLTLR
jgi:hypothetical protein